MKTDGRDGISTKQIVLNVKSDFGAVGGGASDDTQAFQKMIDYINANHASYQIEIPKDYYKITQCLPEISHTEKIGLNMNGSRFLWVGEGDTGNTLAKRRHGIFNFTGQVIGDPLKVKSVDLYRMSEDGSPLSGRITVAADHGFVAGDYIKFAISTGEYRETGLTPKETKILKIEQVIGEDLYVQYWNPFDYQEYIYTATIQKCEPLKGIKISGLTIHDRLDMQGDVKDTAIQSLNRSRYVSGISFLYCTDIEVKDIRGINTKLPVLYAQGCNNIKIENAYLDKPYIVGGGEGYLAQFIDSTNIKVVHIAGESGRHLTDFTGSAFYTVEDANAENMYGQGFQQHGKYEHNGHYIRCRGTFNGGSGPSYGNACRRISFTNCDLSLNNYDTYTDDVLIEDSDIKMIYPLTNAVFKNSRVDMNLNVNGSVRALKNERKLLFQNCDVLLSAEENTNTNGNLADYDEVEWIGGTLQPAINGNFMLSVTNLEKLTIENVKKIERLSFEFRSSGVDLDFKFKQNSYEGSYIYGGVFHPRYASNCRMNIEIEGNEFVKASETPGKLRIFRMPYDHHTNVVVDTRFLDNYVFNGDVEIHEISAKDSVVLKDNIIEGGTIDSHVTNKIIEGNTII